MTRTRVDLGIDLSDAVNELTEIRHHSERYEAEETDAKGRRRRVTRLHQETFPSLIGSLQEALLPAASTEATAAGFESRPAAELEPIAVLAQIETQCDTWTRALKIKRRRTLPDRLHALVGANPTDNQLESMTREAKEWVRRAKIATGWETASFTLNSPCPYCGKRNMLTITGDMTRGICKHCGAQWDEMTIGLLGQMLTHNETETVLSADRCWQTECTAYGIHTVHQDHLGHTWGDTCKLSDPNERMGA